MNKIKLCQSQFTDNKVCACSSLFSASYNDLQLPDISATTFIQCLEFVNPFTTVHEYNICQLLRLFIDNTVVFAAIGREVYACQLTPLCSEGYVCDPQCDWVTHWAIAKDINVNQTV